MIRGAPLHPRRRLRQLRGTYLRQYRGTKEGGLGRALSTDILTIPREQIAKTKVLLTVMGGKDTYRSREF
jgi:hypothetical protein